jgi:hypothetical protein
VIFTEQSRVADLPRSRGRPMVRVERVGLSLSFEDTPFSIAEVDTWQTQHAGQRFALLAQADAAIRITFNAQFANVLRELRKMRREDRLVFVAESIAALQALERTP